jgi:hypothetical protein
MPELIGGPYGGTDVAKNINMCAGDSLVIDGKHTYIAYNSREAEYVPRLSTLAIIQLKLKEFRP